MFDLRDYQFDAVNAVMRDMSEVQKVGLVLPTGAGKTEIFIRIADLWLKENPYRNVLILSHLSILTGQTKDRFRRRAPHVRVGTLKSGERPGIADHVIIGTMQSSRKENINHLLVNRLRKDIGLLIIDEAHYLQTESYDKVVEFYKEAKILGCTATPFRKNQFMTNFFDRISFTMSVQDLIDMGYLVPPKLIQIVLESRERSDVMALVAKTYMQYEKDKKAIVFLKTVEEAKEMASVFEQLGVEARTVTGDVRDEKRDEIIENFNRGRINVLTTVDVLTAGFDSPQCSCIFQPYPTKSITKYLQRIGRGLRPYPGKTECHIYVYGSAPKVEEKYYEKIQNIALNSNGEVRKYDNFKDDWELNDWPETHEEYLYTSNVIKAIERMEEIGMHQLAKMLNFKNFPDRFMEKIPSLLERLPDKEYKIRHGDDPPSKEQIEFLQKFDFTPDQIQCLNKKEASMMIKTIQGNRIDRYTVAHGRYQGYHVSELPYHYIQSIKRNFRNTNIHKMIKAWEKRQRDSKRR